MESAFSRRSTICSTRPKSTHEGWINKLTEEYNEDTYHESLTNTLHAKIDGRFLIMSFTKPSPSRKAMWNERPIQSALIQNQRLYDLQNCGLQLLPRTLPPKKMWSKKYPICLAVKELPLNVYSGNTMEVGVEAALNVDAIFPGETSGEEDEDRRGSSDEDEVAEGEDEATEGEAEDLMTEEELEAKVKEKLASSGLGLLNQMDFEEEDELQYTPGRGSDSQEMVRLCLFARTSRQKEVWLRWFMRARRYPKVDDAPLMEEYLSSMKELMSLLPREPPEDLPGESVFYSGINALLHRVCFDLRRNPKMMEKIGRIIQKRLDAIRLPSVIERFELTQLDLGSRVPFIKHVHQPYLNEHGLWVDMQISFRGNVGTKVKTRINLTQAVERSSDSQESIDAVGPPQLAEDSLNNAELPEPSQIPSQKTSLSNSKTVPDNEQDANSPKPQMPFYGTSRKQKILRFVEKLTRSKMFYTLSKIRVLNRAITNLANTDIFMDVQIHSCDGTLTLNIPPPESNRLWYGFRGVPSMRIKVEPWLGDSRLTNRLLVRIMGASVRKAVQRLVVLPNMIEVPMPSLASSMSDALLSVIPCPSCSEVVSGGESVSDLRRRHPENSERRRSVTFTDQNPRSGRRGSPDENPDS